MKIDIKKYLNVYQYLQDCYVLRKNESPQFSYDVWAKELGASDKSYVRMMVLGKRPINTSMTERFSENLEHSPDDGVYFRNLVQYTQSKTKEQKELLGKQLISLIRSDIDRFELQAHYDFLSNPLLPKLQVMLSFNDINQSEENLGWLLGVDPIQIKEAFNKLVEIKAIEYIDGQYRPLKKSFKVPDTFGNLGLDSFYRNSLDAAKEAIDLPPQIRRFKSLYLPLDEKDFEVYLNNLQEFVNRQIQQFDKDNFEGRSLYQVNFNIIPATFK